MHPAPTDRDPIGGDKVFVVPMLAAIAAAVLFAVRIAPTRGTGFAPGEWDLLVAARVFAAGGSLPLWAGAVHPDATGTWFAAAWLSLPLRLGLSDHAALGAVSAVHWALFVGGVAFVAHRVAGRKAAIAASLGVLLGAPSIFASHGYFRGATVEIAGLELLWLGWAAGGAHRPLRAAALGLGLGALGIGSLHAVLLVPALLIATRGRGRAAALAASAAPLLALGLLRGDAAGSFDVKSLSPTGLLQLTSPQLLLDALRRLPSSLHWGTAGVDAGGALALATGPLALCAATAPLLCLRDPRLRVVGVGAIGLYLALPLASVLVGWPPGYRYAVAASGAGLACLSAVLATARPKAAVPLALLLAAPGLLSARRLCGYELDRAGGAYYAGQHRLSFAGPALHEHFLLLREGASKGERAAFAEGYGLHLGRELHRQSAVARKELADQATLPHPDAAIVARATVRAERPRWWAIASWLEQRDPDEASALLAGIGLGFAEDGVLDETERADAVAISHRAVWRGIGCAFGERAYFLSEPIPSSPTDDAGAAFHEGVAACCPRCLPGSPRLPLFALPHPLFYADVGLLGRGGVPTGPR